MEKIIRGIFNAIRILNIKRKCGTRVEIPIVQPMRISSQLVINGRCKQVKIGKNFKLETNAIVRVIEGGELIIGKNCFVNCHSYITVVGKTTIGDNCLIGPNVLVFDHDHVYKGQSHPTSKVSVGEVSIGNNVWIGGGCIILKGAVIGDNCVIAAGSTVKGVVPPNSLVYQKKETTIVKYVDSEKR